MVRNKAYQSLLAGMRRDNFAPPLYVQPSSLAVCAECGEPIRHGQPHREQYEGWWEDDRPQPLYKHSPACPDAGEEEEGQ